MNFLVDENMPLSFAKILRQLNYNALHVVDIGLFNTDDEIIVDFAKAHNYIIITHDLDFSRIIALSQKQLPSAITFRFDELDGELFEKIVSAHFQQLKDSLENGALITIDENRIRIKPLPIINHS